MSRIINLTVMLQLDIASRLERSELYDHLETMLRHGLGEVLAPSSDAVTVIAAHDPDHTLSQPTNLTPLLEPLGEIAVIWSVEDVQQVRPDLNHQQALEVLNWCHHNHDANDGINWFALEAGAEALFGSKPKQDVGAIFAKDQYGEQNCNPANEPLTMMSSHSYERA